MRVIVALECSECNRRNYTTTKNKKKHSEKLAYKKYCKWCNKRTIHKEVKL
jgi:large subunit ribosomal protein L33